MFRTVGARLLRRLTAAPSGASPEAQGRSLGGSAGRGRAAELQQGPGHALQRAWAGACLPLGERSCRSAGARGANGFTAEGKLSSLPPPLSPGSAGSCRRRRPSWPRVGRGPAPAAAPADVERGGALPRASLPLSSPERGPCRNRTHTHRASSLRQHRTCARPAALPSPGRRSVPLASQSAQYLLSSSLRSLARMAWCCSFCF